MARVYNFSAGPATLPEPVLRQAAAEMLDWNGSGQSVMEMSHRAKDFMSIHAKAQADFRELMEVPDHYKVLFLQGGGTQQFAQVPCNLLRGKKSADYIVSGEWSRKAIQEASLFCTPRLAGSSADRGYTYFPAQSELKISKSAAYVHYCVNETIGGVETFDIPDTGKVPLVADISSTFMSRPIDVSRFGLIYGGAQKNIGPSGLVIVIVHEDLIGKAVPTPPTMFDYKQMADHDSMLNTPPTYGIYIAGLVFQWLKDQGGVKAIEQRNIEKSKLLYDFLDSSKFYQTKVAHANRSRMNVTFNLPDTRLDQAFLDGAKAAGMVQLKGHRVAGGMRASIYNAMPVAGVKHLIKHMREFEQKNG
jgi:phosphoserine aminotransferase